MSIMPRQDVEARLPSCASHSSSSSATKQLQAGSLFSGVHPNKVTPTTPPATIGLPGKLVERPSQRDSKLRRRSSGLIQLPPDLTFRQAFGAPGVALLAVVIVCIAWTTWLISLSLAPNEAANLLMNTGEYDNGNFWLIVDRAPTVKWSSIAGLLLVNAWYVFILARIIRFRHTAAGLCKPKRKLPFMRAWSALSTWSLLQCSPGVKRNLENVYLFYANLTGFNAVNRKLFNTFQKACDLAVQCLVLRRSLIEGLPRELIYAYASFIGVNGLSVVFNVLTGRNTAFIEVIIDSFFDFTAAVLYPIAVLGYCYNNFSFDRDVYLVNAEILAEGNFERLARTQADPAQVALFLINFDSLRISGPMDFALTIGLNLSFCYRFVRVANLMLAENCKLQMKRRQNSQTGWIVKPWQRPVPRWVAFPFLTASTFVVVYTYRAVLTSDAACAAYPECVAFSHVWNTGEQCPCIMLIDGDRAPQTAQEWNSPKDVSNEVRVLASAGLLQELQLINRQLLHWPDELRRCTNLRTISLYYTSSEEIPSWVKEFKELQHLHIEGKYGSRNLVTLPQDLFEDLPSLTFLHFGNHHNLVAIPPFDGTPNLRSITLAVVISLSEIPSLEQIPLLEVLMLLHVPQVVAVPDLSPLTKLSRFSIFRPNHLCCNGFIGDCDLTDGYCQYDPVFNIPPAVCLPPDSPLVATEATRQAFEKFHAGICQKSVAPFAIEALSDTPSPERIASCAGVPYRQCEIPGVTSLNGTEGMCYSSRMQVIACNVDPLFIKARRLQIERGVGPLCDPQEEAWLGCK